MAKRVFGCCVGAMLGEKNRGVMFDAIARGSQVERWYMSAIVGFTK